MISIMVVNFYYFYQYFKNFFQ